MISPGVEQELRSQLDQLPLGLQRQVLDFARALSLTHLNGVPGSALLRFAGTIEPDDLLVMLEAADGDCEQITVQDW